MSGDRKNGRLRIRRFRSNLKNCNTIDDDDDDDDDHDVDNENILCTAHVENTTVNTIFRLICTPAVLSLYAAAGLMQLSRTFIMALEIIVSSLNLHINYNYLTIIII